MSELKNSDAQRSKFRWQLLTTVSVLALLVNVYSAQDAEAADGPPIWIELGGQFDQLNAAQSPWTLPSNFSGNASPPLDHPPPTSVGDVNPRIGFDADGKITFEPSGGDWILSASVRYGRASRGPKNTKDQSYNYEKYGRPSTPLFVATRALETERHLIVDFQAGKDVGLGMKLNHSIVNFGVRIAQFSSRLQAHISSIHPTVIITPDGRSGHAGKYPAAGEPYGDADITHTFTGIGPSISWDASVPVLGSQENGFSFEWNANGSVLFGRQKTTTHLTTREVQHWYSYAGYIACHCAAGGYPSRVSNQQDTIHVRSREALVPGIGGLVGISYHLARTKISFGYRADFFFNAVDAGDEARKSYDRSFYGPFANISVGIGG